MSKIKWVVRELLYLPRFLILCLLAIIFGLINYRKGIDKIKKLL